MKKLSVLEYEVIKEYVGRNPCKEDFACREGNKRTDKWLAVRNYLIDKGYLSGEDCKITYRYHVWPTKLGKLAINIYEVCRSLEVA